MRRRVAAAAALVIVPLAAVFVVPAVASATGTPPVITSITPNIGLTAGGATVTIDGSGLTGATAVDFGMSPAASFDVVSDSEIQAVTPPHPPSVVPVTVVTPVAGSMASMTEVFTFEGPYVTKVVPSVLPISGGKITVTGAGFAGAFEAHVGPSIGLNVVHITNMVLSISVPPLPVGIDDVTVTTPVGTSPAVPSDHVHLEVPALNQVMPVSGAANRSEWVMLNGAALSSASAVDFGSVAASNFVIRGANGITALAPPEPPGTVAVTVITPAGVTAVTAHDYFTYRPPTVSHVAPMSGTSAGGTNVLIAGSLFGGLSGVTFGGVPATSFVLEPTGTIMAVSPAHADGTVDVQVTANAGTSVPTAMDHFTYVG
jgi:hypothetical protein